MVESYSGNKFNCDVLIVGGGVAGCAAAIVAARRGQRVLLLEKDYALGGIATSGYVTGIAGCVEGMSKEWFERMVELGWGRKLPNDLKHCVFDPSKAKMMLERMICEQGGRVLYGTYVIDAEVEDKQIKKVICQSVSGRFEISAKVYRCLRRCCTVSCSRCPLCGRQPGIPGSQSFHHAGVQNGSCKLYQVDQIPR